MSLHLIKLSVGTDSVADLEDWIKLKLKEKKRRGQKAERIHTTRMVPKRADELTSGGSPTRTASAVAGWCSIRNACWLSRARARRFRAGAISRTKRRRAICRA